MFKPLYDREGRYTKEASQLDKATEQLLRTPFANALSDGYSPREIAHIMQNAVTMMELDAVLR